MNLEEELKKILAQDPLNILKIKSRGSSVSPDQKLIDSFEEISKFREETGKKPEKNNDIKERTLFSRLEQLKKDPNKIKTLKGFDRFNLLGDEVNLDTVEDLLESDYLGILDNEETDIFNLENVPESKDRPDFVAKRKTCEDFSLFEDLFKEVHKDLQSGERKVLRFKDQDLREKGFYILNGILVYIESVDWEERELKDKAQGSRIRNDGRTRCIFENGLESNMYIRSLQKQLYMSGSSISESNLESTKEFNKNLLGIPEDQDPTGFIYVLSTLSDNTEINSIKNLHKIGYTEKSVKERIKNADSDPTFLMAPVKIKAVYDCYGQMPIKFEDLIHNLFRERCLDITIHDKYGAEKKPQEWYVVPFLEIDKAIPLIDSGEIVNYMYDPIIEKLVLKE